MYTAHCKGCKVSEETEISLQTGDNLAVLFTSLVVEIPAIEHPSLKDFRNQEQLSIYDCLDAFSERSVSPFAFIYGHQQSIYTNFEI